MVYVECMRVFKAGNGEQMSERENDIFAMCPPEILTTLIKQT